MTQPLTADLISRVQQFVFMEARLQDDHQYEAWESLWTDDGIYWVPANGDNIDPEREMSIIYDNRSRIALRIRQLLTGKHHTQAPPSRLRRLVSNVEVLGQTDDGEIEVGANTMIFESNLRDDTIWATRNEYRLRPEGDAWRMAYKKVRLVNNDKAIYTLSFLV